MLNNYSLRRRVLFEKTKKTITATWNIEAAQDLQALHSIDLEDELMAAFSKSISDEIDKEIIFQVISMATERSVSTRNVFVEKDASLF